MPVRINIYDSKYANSTRNNDAGGRLMSEPTVTAAPCKSCMARFCYAAAVALVQSILVYDKIGKVSLYLFVLVKRDHRK